jgi:DNA-binding IclR family transcriptional regulator
MTPFSTLPPAAVDLPAAAEISARPAGSRHHSSMFNGVEALMVLLRARRSIGITQLAAALGLSKSTTHDLAGALCALGFVDQHPQSRRYSVSPAIFQFLHVVSTGYGPNTLMKPIVQERAAQLRAAIVVTALRERTTYALCASGTRADTFLVGDHGPAYNSACGKVLVAQHDESEWAQFVPQPGDRPFTPYSNLNPERFLAELAAAKVNGVAFSLRERDARLCSVAAPIRTGDKPWNRAVGIMLPYEEWIVRDRDELVAAVKALAQEIAEVLPG